MKDAFIIFVIGLMTIGISITTINHINKKEPEKNAEVLCTNGGVPDWNCIPKLHK